MLYFSPLVLECGAMAFTHRPLEEGDAEAICAFAQSEEELTFFFPKAVYPLTPKQLLKDAEQTDAPTVALLQDQVVGYADIVNVRPNLFCTLGHLVVSPSHRRQGVATYLVKRLIQMAKERHSARFVRTACHSHNTAAYQLCHGLGFQPTDMVPRPAPDGGTILLVNMELACHRM